MAIRLLALGCYMIISATLAVSAQDRPSVVETHIKDGERPMPARRGTPIDIRFHCVQLDIARLQKLGLRWELPREPLDEEQAQEFYRLVGGVLSSGPYGEIRNVQMSARAGQPVTIQNFWMKVQAAPKFIENGDLEVRLSIENMQFSQTDRRLDLERTFVVQPGNVAYLGPLGTEKIAEGEPKEESKVATLLFASVSTLDRVAPPLIQNRVTPGLYQPHAPMATAPAPHAAGVLYPVTPVSPQSMPRAPSQDQVIPVLPPSTPASPF